MKIKTNRNTIFKVSAADSSTLSAAQKVGVVKGVEYELASFDYDNKHIIATFKGTLNGHRQLYVFKEHVDIIESIQNTKKESPILIPKGRAMKFPGFSSTFYTDAPVFEGSHFTWGEMLKGGSRLPESKEAVLNIIKIVRELEKVRTFFDNRAITINSGYRPKHVNRKIGSSDASRHVVGDAADIVVSGLSAKEVQRRLDPWWPSGLGYGATYTHLDARGYRARWNYS